MEELYPITFSAVVSNLDMKMIQLIIGFSLMVGYVLLLFILCIPFMGIKNVWQQTNLDILTLLMAIIINALIY